MRAFQGSLRREIAFLAAHFWDRALLSLAPLALMALLAVEMSSGVMRDLPVVVVDADASALSRELVRRLDAAPALKVVEQTGDMAAGERLVRMRRAYLLVFIPAEVTRDVLRGETGKITLFFNASYATPSGAALREASNVISAYAGELSARQTAAIVGPGKVRAAPLGARTTVLHNPQGSYELQLVGLLHPAMLHLVFMVAVVSALGRELRDGAMGAWLNGSTGENLARVAGKLTPYLAAFMAWGLAACLYLATVRGWPIAGSLAMVMAGYAAMYLAYVGVALLFVGLTASMAQSLSLTGIYAGASFAFAGAIFPVESASAFARVWSALLPFTAFANLWAEQFVMASPVAVSLRQILVLLVFLAVGAAIGLPRYLHAAQRPDLWGKR
ncbi:MAG: hypothetical protein ABS77_13225 [Phenylobacterium sp. SCN 69-14]|nr:MAG: hypothetical protein ABS77_13225 [Phenylobacterium sp. SCN 69-14]